jgi:hypothetical protein
VKAERTNGEEGVGAAVGRAGAAVGRAIFGRKIPGSAPEKMTLACADKVNQGPEEREPMKLEIKRRQERSQDASMEPPQLACGGNQHDQMRNTATSRSPSPGWCWCGDPERKKERQKQDQDLRR